MFGRKKDQPNVSSTAGGPAPVVRVNTVLGPGIHWHGDLKGEGGVRVEGVVDGEVDLRGLLVIGETGRLNSTHIRANTVVVAGAVRGDITAEKVEIRRTGRVWGNVTTMAFATEEGAFLRGQIQMEEHIALGPPPENESEA
ncbi:MAG: polymer-forming cytoskeletal protein [Anaerolineae bacterium]|nr:MAG: polymer-forming cytoskeletal protein [Anaerolineae bacterium]